MARAGAAGTASVAVIGAGPCGLAAAIALKQAGVAVAGLRPIVPGEQYRELPHVHDVFLDRGEDLDRRLAVRDGGREADATRGARATIALVVQHFGLVLRLYEPVTEIVRDGEHFVVRSADSAGLSRDAVRCRRRGDGIFRHAESAACAGRVAAARDARVPRGARGVSAGRGRGRRRQLGGRCGARPVALRRARSRWCISATTSTPTSSRGSCRTSRTASRMAALRGGGIARHPDRRGCGD